MINISGPISPVFKYIFVFKYIVYFISNKEEDGKTIRVSLINLIKYYITHDITADECSQLIAFLIVVKEEVLVSSSH